MVSLTTYTPLIMIGTKLFYDLAFFLLENLCLMLIYFSNPKYLLILNVSNTLLNIFLSKILLCKLLSSNFINPYLMGILLLKLRIPEDQCVVFYS